jgi:predicted CXXCH cytochrome family protein
LATANGYFGTDLSNDHPIGITYDNTATGDTAFVDPAVVATNLGVPLATALPGTKVECSSCHSVHDTTYMPFLRISNDNSAICLACHVK